MKIKIVEGTVDELRHFEQTEDYIHANLTDKTFVLDAMDQLRKTAFPNIFSIQFTSLEQKLEAGGYLGDRA